MYLNYFGRQLSLVFCMQLYVLRGILLPSLLLYIYMHMFFIYLISVFQGLSKHSRLFGNPVSLLTGKLRQYSLVRHFSRAVSLVVLPKRRFRPSASSDSLTGCDDLVIFL